MITEFEYEAAMDRIAEIWDADRSTPEGEEIERLIALVMEYEDFHYPVGEITPRAAAQFRREQGG